MRRPLHLRLSPAGFLAALCLALALPLLFAAPAAADGIIIPQPPRDRPISWREIPLAVKYHRVDVQIKDQVATTHVDQVFVNEATFPVEGTYLFPLPEDAAISSFDMWVDGRKIEGKLLGRAEARAIYEEIVRQQRDPALLEYVGRGAFQASIFPIPPRGERRIELAYNQVLPQSGGMIHYRYPLNTEKFSARAISEVAVTIRLEDKAPLRAIYSPSHPSTVTRQDEHRATVSYAARNVRPDRDFDLYYSVSADPLAVNLLSYKPYDEDGFFLLLLTPPVRPPDDAIVDKDVILVVDTSGSMDGEKIVQAKAAAAYVLDHLGEGDRFNLVSFNTATRLFAEAPVSRSRRADGQAFVSRLTAQGSTDINRALLEAVSGADKERPTVVIFLTDGLPTVGEKNPDRIVANVTSSAPKSVRLFAFGVGNDVDTVLLDQLSGGLRGTSAYVRPGQKIDEEVSGFFAKVSAPVLVDLKLDVAGVRVEEIYPYPLPDLFADSQLVVAGRYRQGGAATLRLSGQVNGRPQSYTYQATFANRGGDDFIARLWAQRKIGYLLAQIRLSGVKDELVKEIVALSTRYGIVTPYTSFLVEEPGRALTESGRDQLSQDLQRPATAPPAAPRSGGGPGKAPEPTQAPALVPQMRAGASAVERAVTEQELKASEQAASSAAQVRQVGDKTFLLSQGVWVDTTFDATAMAAEKIAFGSERYFQLLTQYPEIGPYLAQGDRVTVVLSGKAYAIDESGQTSVQPSQPGASPTATASRPTATASRPTATASRPTATASRPTATASRPTAASATPGRGTSVPPSPAAATRAVPTAVPTQRQPTATIPATVVAASQPTAAAQPAAATALPVDTSGMPSVCPGVGMIGLLGVFVPVWAHRRRNS